MIENILIPAGITGGLGLLFGIGLAYASKKFAVKGDEKIEQVKEILPGANCGACGYSGCEGFAKGVVKGEVEITGCPVGGNEVSDKIAMILGVETKHTEKMAARVMCSGHLDNCSIKYLYEGISSCRAAADLYAGSSDCSKGCLGYGDCAEACPFNSIIIRDGLAKVIESSCMACGLCINTCPKGIIQMVPEKSKYSVLCSSTEKGAVVRKLCSEGCIGCKKCEKACPFGAIKITDMLAKIDPALCKNCGKCVKECPTGAIKKIIKC